MKITIVCAMIIALFDVAKAQNAAMNSANILLSQRAVTASELPTSGWFQLTGYTQGEGLKLKPIQVYQVSLNPSTDVMTVSQPRDKAMAGVWQIFDASDKLRWSQKVNEKDIEMAVNIQELSEGIYFVSFVVNGERRFTQKLIKIKSN
jgi:hypothetical protein